MRKNQRAISLHDLIEGFLFSLRAEGKSARTHEFYYDLLNTLSTYAKEQKWPDNFNSLDVQKFRGFLSWTGSREIIQNNRNGNLQKRKAKPSTAFHYFRAVRRLFNWAISEGYKQRPLDLYENSLRGS